MYVRCLLSSAHAPRREGRFLAAAALTVLLCVAAALWFAVPLQPGTRTAAQSEPAPLAQAARVDLNTANVEALCTLPGVGEKRAQAIVDYRVEHGGFASVQEAADVPGLTQTVVDSWAGLAYVSKTLF